MVYLINSTDPQQVYIPKNEPIPANYKSQYEKGYDDGYAAGQSECPSCDVKDKSVVVSADTQTVYPDSGYAGMSSVDIDATDYGNGKYSEGYQGGYSEGEADQKARLSSATFVENGNYELENGWSAVTVQTTCPPPNLEDKNFYLESGFTPTTVTPSSGYDGLSSVRVEDHGYGQERYDAGVSAGEASQKARLSSTAFTQNGDYTLENGWSAVTVEVSGGTPCSLEDKQFGIFSGDAGVWEILPDSGYDGMSRVEVIDEGYGNGKYNEGVAAQKALLTSTAFTQNGTYTRTNGWSSVTVNTPSNLQDKSVVMTANTETFYPDSSSGSVKAIQTDGYCWFDTGIIPDINTEVRCSFSPLAEVGRWNVYYGSQSQDDGPDSFQMRRADGYNMLSLFVGGRQQMTANPSYNVGDWLETTLNKNSFTYSVNGGSQRTVSMGASSFQTSTLSIYIGCVNNPNWFPTGDSVDDYRPGRGSCAQYGAFQIYQSGVLVADYIPTIDGNNVPCFYDEITHAYVYHSGSGTPIAITESVSDYDGMSAITVDASGIMQDAYDSGVAAQQALLSSTAFTGNGTYTRADGWSSVTVSIPVQEITYTSTDGNIVSPYATNPFLDENGNPITVISNTYSNGVGRIKLAKELYALNTNTFHGRNNLREITFPSSLTEIGNYALMDCPNLIVCNIPASVSAIGTSVFMQTAVKSIYIPDGVTTIPNSVGTWADGLSTLIIGSGVTSIGASAFAYANCSGCTCHLTSIYAYAPTAPTLGIRAFEHIPTGGILYVPTGSDYSSWLTTLPTGWTISATL